MEPEKEEVLKLLESSGSMIEKMCNGSPFAGSYIKNSVAFVGDTHCAWQVSSKVISEFSENVDLIVFLGDYVDRGNTGIENLMVILNAFVRNPGKIILLRGNHESRLVNDRYGFRTEVDSKMGQGYYSQFERFFSRLPYAAVVNDYFCVHGGIARKIHTIEELTSLPYPDLVPEDKDTLELLWNDPSDDADDFSSNMRGEGTFCYGRDAVDRFLLQNGLKGIIRGHEVCDGFKTNIEGKVITVFSSLYHNKLPGVLLMDSGGFAQVRIDINSPRIK